jgi:acyl-CoA synthetase (AMP-forming)/AMP-acid ligase II
LYITGRSKDLITQAGVNVSPQAVEWAVEQALNCRPVRWRHFPAWMRARPASA